MSGDWQQMAQQAIDLHRRGDPAAALPLYRTLLSVRPDVPALRTLISQALVATGSDSPEALREATKLDPASPGPLLGLACLARDGGDEAGAVFYFGEALARDPNLAEAQFSLACALKALGRQSEAEGAFRAAIALRPEYFEALTNLGHMLMDHGRFGEAEPCFRAAARVRPDDAMAHNNLGTALYALDRFDEAEGNFRQALRLRPDYPLALVNLSSRLMLLNRVDEAEQCLRQALGADPSMVLARYNLSLVLLLTGRLAEGWEGYEARWAIGGQGLLARRDLPRPLWDGSPLGHRVLLAHAEQGFGDTLQFCRYVAEAARLGRVVLEVPRPLVRLMRRLPGVADVIAAGGPLPAFDVQCPLLSLPRALGTRTVRDIPASVPYLAADPAAVAHWKARLAPLPGLKVGLVWSGSPRNDSPATQAADRRRSLSLATLLPWAGISGISWISLQKGEAARQGEAVADRWPIHDWTDELGDFADTAALIEAVDLVISVDTSVVHLAGGLGRPVWLLNRFDTCWRWLLERDDSPWYPTLRQFRQPGFGAWAPVVRQVGDALGALTRSRRERVSASDRSARGFP